MTLHCTRFFLNEAPPSSLRACEDEKVYNYITQKLIQEKRKTHRKFRFLAEAILTDPFDALFGQPFSCGLLDADAGAVEPFFANVAADHETPSMRPSADAPQFGRIVILFTFFTFVFFCFTMESKLLQDSRAKRLEATSDVSALAGMIRLR